MRNRKPKVGNASVSLQEDSSIVLDVLANDFDRDGDVLTITTLSDPANGTATLEADGTITYTPDPEFNGVDSFTYTIDDGHGGTSGGKVTVTVTPVNDAPVVDSGSVTVAEESQGAALGLTPPTDAGGDPLTITVVSLPELSKGTVTLVDGTAVSVG